MFITYFSEKIQGGCQNFQDSGGGGGGGAMFDGGTERFDNSGGARPRGVGTKKSRRENPEQPNGSQLPKL